MVKSINMQPIEKTIGLLVSKTVELQDPANGMQATNVLLELKNFAPILLPAIVCWPMVARLLGHFLTVFQTFQCPECPQ